MKQTWTDCLPCSRRAGLTLIEVVAGIAILGVILVGIVMARSRHIHQLAEVGRVRRAIELTDRMVEQWWITPQALPIDKTGSVPGDESLVWRTRVERHDVLDPMGARVVRVEVFEAQTTAVADALPEPLVALDLVLPQPPEPEETDDAGPGGDGSQGP